MTTAQDKVQEKIAEIAALHAKQDRLLEQLKRSTLLRDFYPNAFKTGSCSCYVVGNPWKPKAMRFVIKTGDGETHEFPLLEVPVVLWESFKDRLRHDTRGSVKVWRA